MILLSEQLLQRKYDLKIVHHLLNVSQILTGFLGALLAPLAASLAQPVISLVVKSINGEE